MPRPAFPESLLAYALATISEGSLITDATYRTLYANAAFSAITGYSEAEMLDQNCRILQGPDTDPKMLERLRQALTNGTPFRGALLNYRKDGSSFWNDVTISPLRDSRGEITHFVSVQRDISPQINLQNQLRVQAAARPSWQKFGRAQDAPSAQASPPAPPTDAAARQDSYRRLLRTGGLLMYMQPVVQLQTGVVRHVEALARLRLPDHATVPPDVFLPFLGQPELNELFRKGLNLALGWLAEWDRTGLKLHISVNLLPSTLRDPACLDWITRALGRHRIEPCRLGIELLETEPVDTDSAQAEALRSIAATGVQLIMDDLGSGYGSLTRFSTFDFDAVKIDRGLTAHIGGKPQQTLTLLRALINVCHDFERRVVAEGLEDAGMLEALTILGADCGQGEAIAKPMPAEDLTTWMKAFKFANNPQQPTTALGALAREAATNKTQV